MLQLRRNKPFFDGYSPAERLSSVLAASIRIMQQTKYRPHNPLADHHRRRRSPRGSRAPGATRNRTSTARARTDTRARSPPRFLPDWSHVPRRYIHCHAMPVRGRSGQPTCSPDSRYSTRPALLHHREAGTNGPHGSPPVYRIYAPRCAAAGGTTDVTW